MPYPPAPDHRPTPPAVLGLLFFLGLGVFSGCVCFGPPPGKGKKAELGYARAAPVIEALAAHEKREGAYPDTLEALVTAGDLEAMPPGTGKSPLRYRRVDPSYELVFSYEGPGMNTCTYRPETAWSCSGYF